MYGGGYRAVDPTEVRDLEWGLGTAPVCIYPLDEGGRRSGGECRVGS